MKGKKGFSDYAYKTFDSLGQIIKNDDVDWLLLVSLNEMTKKEN